MEASNSLQDRETLNNGFLLLAHIICADQQIHSDEARALKDLAHQIQVSPLTLRETEKILEQEESRIALDDAAQKVPIGQRSEVLRQILAIAYIDGYFSPLEREVVDQIAQIWGIYDYEIEQMLEEAQGFGQSKTKPNEGNEQNNGLSVGARLLRGAESVLSQSLISRLKDLAPKHLGEKIEQLQREILLSGPEYDEAIQRCGEIAKEDFQYCDMALRNTFTSLKQLGNSFQKTIASIKQKTAGKGDSKTAKDVAKQLESTRKNLTSHVLHDLESVREALIGKQRSLGHFNIAFMGRTKAGKSTLHAIITGEGWDAIGIGKQRTTRYNRVYEWKNIRIIDTPGIGAPGGKSDEEIARSVIEEADVICYVVTDDSIQESEFAFLKLLKEKTKPLIILLNIKHNLRDSRRLQHFLRNPDRWFTMEGKSGIGGHISRIHRYAKEHYSNNYLPIILAMILAAQLAQEDEHKEKSKELFKASHIQDFLDSIRVSLVDHGMIRRSQTLLGSTVGSIDTPYQWIVEQINGYEDLTNTLKQKRKELKLQMDKAQEDNWNELQQNIKEIFQSVQGKVNYFAEHNWECNQSQLGNEWKNFLKSQSVEERLKSSVEKASLNFQHNIQEALEEIGNELEIISQLRWGNFDFSRHDPGFFDKNWVRITGMVLTGVGGLLLLFFPPFGMMALAGGILSFAADLFKSRSQKRHEAVTKITQFLKPQLQEWEEKVLKETYKDYKKYCESIESNVDKYFEVLIQGLEEIAAQLRPTQEFLVKVINYLNRAYAKRIINWATDHSEPLTDISINKVILRVNRDFGKRMQIQTMFPVSLTKSQEEISTVLQETISIQPITS